jgi:hypothetical protein
MHFSFSSLMFKTLSNKFNNGTLSDEDIKSMDLIPNLVSQSEFEEIVREAVEFEKEFVTDASVSVFRKFVSSTIHQASMSQGQHFQQL